MTARLAVGFDGSAASRRALAWAAAEAEIRSASVQVVACLPAPETLNPWYRVMATK